MMFRREERRSGSKFGILDVRADTHMTSNIDGGSD